MENNLPLYVGTVREQDGLRITIGYKTSFPIDCSNREDPYDRRQIYVTPSISVGFNVDGDTPAEEQIERWERVALFLYAKTLKQEVMRAGKVAQAKTVLSGIIDTLKNIVKAGVGSK